MSFSSTVEVKPSRYHAFLFLIMPFLSPVVRTVSASSATWNLNPTTGDWNTAANWTPATVPNGSSDTATFELSNMMEVSLSGFVEVDSIAFNPGAASFTISTTASVSLDISGAGIINNSGGTEQFLIPEGSNEIEFFNDATAGTGTVFIAQGSASGASGGIVNFWDNSSAGDASFTLEGGGIDARTVGGHVAFMGNSTAANATFVCKGGGDGSFGGTLAYTGFYENSSAGNATIIAEGDPDRQQNGFPGVIIFSDQSKAENATLIAKRARGSEGGLIIFNESATGDNASVKIFGNGMLEIFLIAGPSLTIGSLEGDGLVALGDKNLIVGRNNTNTTFSGQIYNTGSLTKIGAGTLVLASANTYSGDTNVKRGRLLTNNSTGSATGMGSVQVGRGAFGGKGSVAGAVTIGDGSAPGAALVPGIHGTGLLTIRRSLTFKENSRYNWNVEATAIKADEVVAQGITIEPEVLFATVGRGNVPLPPGTIFTVIRNTAATPISGTFSNLGDGGTITVGGNTFQASYEGGDGNDLILTIVP